MSPMTIGNLAGDPALVYDDYLDVNIIIPDTGFGYVFNGVAGKKGGTVRVVASQTVAGTGVPGAGTNYDMWQVACESPSTADGTITKKTSTSAFPAPDAGCLAVFQQAQVAGADTSGLNDTSTTPDL